MTQTYTKLKQILLIELVQLVHLHYKNELESAEDIVLEWSGTEEDREEDGWYFDNSLQEFITSDVLSNALIRLEPPERQALLYCFTHSDESYCYLQDLFREQKPECKSDYDVFADWFTDLRYKAVDQLAEIILDCDDL